MTSRALKYIHRTPWAMTPDALELMVALAERELEVAGAVQRVWGGSLDDAPRVRVRDGVGVVSLVGPIFSHATLFSDVSGAVSAERLATDLEAALESPDVRALVLAIDSPGGQVAGTDEVAELIYRARDRMPVIAHVAGAGASAAYWIASAATEVVVAPTAMVGSIGAVVSVRRRDPDSPLEFVSSVSPRKRADPEDPDGAAEIQAVVDAVGAEFVRAVARYRGVPEATVLERYGGGAVFVGAAAVEAGLADRVAILDDVVTELAVRRPGPVQHTHGGIHMDTEMEITTGAQIRELYPEAAAELAAEAAATARAEGIAEGRRTAMEILGLHAPGLEDTRAELAADAEVSVAEAALRLSRELVDRDAEAADAWAAGRAEADASGAPAAIPSPATDDPDAEFRALMASAFPHS